MITMDILKHTKRIKIVDSILGAGRINIGTFLTVFLLPFYGEFIFYKILSYLIKVIILSEEEFKKHLNKLSRIIVLRMLGFDDDDEDEDD